MHRSGYVNIIGRPNVGKSTLMNTLVGEQMSIITHKPQTTRHRIIGIVNGEDYQIVFSDTPGFITDTAYKMHEAMNRFVTGSFEDADVMLFMIDGTEKYTDDDPLIKKLKKLEVPLFLIINKIDRSTQEEVTNLMASWKERIDFAEIIPISALEKAGTATLIDLILKYLPEGPAYYPKDQLTDKTERFFVSEIIREKILEQYREEIPYSVEVTVEYFKEEVTKKNKPITHIHAIIFVARKTQKSILIGKNGSAIRKLGTAARKSIEGWLGQQVFLDLRVKVRENWRDDDKWLSSFGYE